jgi:hypothetical protein
MRSDGRRVQTASNGWLVSGSDIRASAGGEAEQRNEGKEESDSGIHDVFSFVCLDDGNSASAGALRLISLPRLRTLNAFTYCWFMSFMVER